MDTSSSRTNDRWYLMLIARLIGVLLILTFIMGSTAPSILSDASNGIWRDEFDFLDLETWQSIGVEPSIITLDSNSYLRMPASQVAEQPNLLLRSVAPGDFTITTRVLFEPTVNFQIAGLYIFINEGTHLTLGRAYCDVPDMCVGNGIYFDAVLDGQWVGSNFATSVNELSAAYLRLERRGEMVRAFYSHDGHTSWIEIGTHWIPGDLEVSAVGLIAAQDFSAAGINADFDYFSLSEGFEFLPEGFHDYDSGDVPSWGCNAGGWAADPDDLLTDVNVEIVVDDQTITALPAAEFRQDLADAGVCVDGNCSFHVPLWGSISSYQPHKVAVWAQDNQTSDWVLLSNSNKPLTCRTYDIYTFDSELGVTRQITDMRDSLEFNPEWSPDGKKVVYEVFGLDGTPLGVHITDLKTGASVPLAGAEGGNDPDWSPNGKWIAFDREPVGDPNLYVVPPAGGLPTLLIEDAISASWAPNSKRIAFERPSEDSIWTMDLESQIQTYIGGDGMSPAWAPNGEWIAYRRGDSIAKVRVNNNGLPLGDPIQLTNLIPDSGQPSWSHNSKTIVFHSGMTGDYDLWTIPAAGGESTWLTGALNFGDYDPAYTPKGISVAYASFSGDGQAARHWGSAYTADVPDDLLTTEGLHTYSYEWEWTVPEPGSLIPEYSQEVLISEDAPLYDGKILLRYRQLRGIHTPGEFYCEDVDAVHPDQPKRLVGGWMTDSPMIYPEAAAHFASLTSRVVLDGNVVIELAPHEVFSWSSNDWMGYVCTLTEAPLKMDLRVNYGHDWVESFYEAGHWVDITVTESDGVTVKATASVFTEPKDWWDWKPGFQTTPEDWFPSPPDLQPYDWVYARVDNGATAQVQLGEIHGVINYLNRNVTGTVLAPWIADPVSYECLDWGPSGGGFYLDEDDLVMPDGYDPYTCSWNPEEWEVQPWQDVGVGYSTPDGHWVANAFTAQKWMAFWTYYPPADFLTDGAHEYNFGWAYEIPEPNSGISGIKTINVSSGAAQFYPGKVLLWTYDPQGWTGEGCEAVTDIHPEQDVGFVVGWVSDFSMTEEEAQAHFGSFTMQAFWDGIPQGPEKLVMGDLMAFTSIEDRLATMCSLTGNP